MKKLLISEIILALMISTAVSVPAAAAPAADSGADTQSVQEDNDQYGSDKKWNELAVTDTMELKCSDQFSVTYYEGGYKLLTIGTDQRMLLIPEGMEEPEGLDSDIIPLYAPLDRIYLVATAAMDYFVQLDSISNIKLSSQKTDGWYIEEAKEAVENGDMVYAGKYSAPDYEMILSSGCDLAIENTMIYHTPEVKEKLESLGIPVIVEKSGYETDPLGRMEWIKFYGALMNKEAEAEEYFNELYDQVNEVIGEESTGKTVAFFFINSNGSVTVRKSKDYVAKSIELAGGEYIEFDDTEEENALSTMTIQMETFYAAAREADILIYNSTIDGELQTIDQLIQKDSLMADFKAVKDGNVWCVSKNFYQEPLKLGSMIIDIHKILLNQDTPDDELTFLHKLQ